MIKELEKAGLRGRVKVIVGGNAVTEEFGRKIGTDAVTNDALVGVRIYPEWNKR